MSGTIELEPVLKIRTSVFGEATVVVVVEVVDEVGVVVVNAVVVMALVVVVGQIYSSHGHPFGHPD